MRYESKLLAVLVLASSQALFILDAEEPHLRLSHDGWEDHRFVLSVHGSNGVLAAVDFSLNLVNWVPRHTNFIEDGFFQYADPVSAAAPALFFRAREVPPPTDTTAILMATRHFPDINAGEVPAYKDTGRNALAINAAEESYRDKFAAAEARSPVAPGKYDVTITTLTEVDGESSYRFLVNDVLVGTVQNPRSDTDYQEVEHAWTGVEIPAHAALRVEFNTHSNGLIPEGSGFAWARGRWRQLEIEPAASGADSVSEE